MICAYFYSQNAYPVLLFRVAVPGSLRCNEDNLGTGPYSSKDLGHLFLTDRLMNMDTRTEYGNIISYTGDLMRKVPTATCALSKEIKIF